ncbi:hypothetical protein LJY25_14645 [Hymenobacter sp. BT175]|uniref:hypothetical protein n=1 Tax=Hymenobacter translucens TaxID=2886507 RepID=UPI001D0E4B9F|nr:hypothetical protein [Hymenobacter translucens]MCC2547691.1 hypothetical protein [Hymenobacter translucens]
MEATVSTPFIKLLRNPLTEQLIRQPNCLAVLTLVAYRARRSDELSLNGLSEGEAMMGDFDACGLTRQEFRTALNKLLAWGFVTTRTTNRGTVVKLISSAVYDINSATINQQSNQQTTSQQPTSNQLATTNKKDKKERSKNTLSDSASASSDAEVDLSFAAFWELYGRKEGSKAKMTRQWNALPPSERGSILAGLKAYREAKTQNGPQFMPMPQTFLNGRLWEAETYGKVLEPAALTAQQRAAIPSKPFDKDDLFGFNDPRVAEPQPRYHTQPAGQYAGTIR